MKQSGGSSDRPVLGTGPVNPGSIVKGMSEKVEAEFALAATAGDALTCGRMSVKSIQKKKRGFGDIFGCVVASNEDRSKWGMTE